MVSQIFGLAFANNKRSSVKKHVGKPKPIPRSFNFIPISILTLLINERTKKFYTQNKNIRGDWVSLSETSRRFKFLQLLTIKQKGDRSERNTAKDKLHSGILKSKAAKNIPHKVPFHTIIRFRLGGGNGVEWK